ncbi:MAG TPA: hypothetical protein VM390_06885 [Acidimicrobiales bacterium]|nr:hypothetical protein [Acidimicrobiales bacterium]
MPGEPYFLDPPQISVAGGSDVPGWVLLGAGVALGMGVAMVAAYGISRRSRTAPTAQRVAG